MNFDKLKLLDDNSLPTNSDDSIELQQWINDNRREELNLLSKEFKTYKITGIIFISVIIIATIIFYITC